MPTEAGVDAADVSVLIPAFEAEAFIDRTLACARAQTHAQLRILVSVDAGEDRTEAICRRHAAEDARIEVHAQPRRLGWSENANFLLARAQTPFCFLSFHDDMIAPEYVERLRAALVSRPDAASAHCDLERFGTMQGMDPGHAYEGSAGARLLAYLVAPVKGTLLRSLLRRATFPEALRFPAIGEAGFWRTHPFVLQLLAAGPALHVDGAMYRRWFREGSLTTKWGPTHSAPLLEGQRESARLCLDRVDLVAADDEERALLRHGLYLFMMAGTRWEESHFRPDRPLSAAQIHPALAAAAHAPDCLDRADPLVRDWFAHATHKLAELEARLAPVPT